MQSPPTTPQRSLWEQIDWVWHVATGVLLCIYLGLKLGQGLPTERWIPILVLTALLALWYARFVVTPFIIWQIYHKRRLPYFILGFALWAALIAVDANALLLTGIFLPLILSRFPLPWALTIIGALAIAIVGLYTWLYAPALWLVSLAIVLVLAVAIVVVRVVLAARAARENNG